MLTLRRAIKPALLAAGGAAGGLRLRRAPVHHDAVMHPSSVKRVLVWTMNSLGDVLRATPAIAALRNHYRDAHITMVAAGRAAPILRNNPDIDELIEIPAAYNVLQHRAAIRRITSQNAQWDLGILLEVNAAWTLIEGIYLRWIGVRRWVCFDFGHGVSRRAVGVRLGHEGSWIDQFNRLVAVTGAEATNRRMKIQLTPQERESAAGHLRSEGLDPDEPFFLVHPGGNALEVSRRWPAESYASLLTEMWNRWRLPVVLTGTAPEQSIISQIKLQTRAPVVDLCGRLSMRELAAVIDRASLCVMNDTGPLHISNALRRPTVAILGPTDPQVVGIPETTEAVRLSLPCSPCARFAGWRACTNVSRYQCLHEITPDMVLAAVSRLMSPGVRLVVLEPALQQMLESVGQDAEVSA